jgi:hypothetical protein
VAGYSKLVECVVCRHKRVSAIDAAQEAGEDDIKIAQRFSVTKIALRKHATHKASAAEASPSAETPPSPPPKTSSLPSNVVPLHPCPICRHEQREAIEEALGAGGTWATVGRHFLVEAKDVKRHALECLGGAFKRPAVDIDKAAANARARCLALVQTVEQLIEDVTNDDEASYSDKAKLLSAGQRLIESLGRFTGELALTIDESRIVASPAWKRCRWGSESAGIR